MHSFFLCCVVYVGRYDEGFSLKPIPPTEWMASSLLNATFINYTLCLGCKREAIQQQRQQKASKQSKHFEILILNQAYISQTSSHKRVILLMQCFFVSTTFSPPRDCTMSHSSSSISTLFFPWGRGQWISAWERERQCKGEFDELVWSRVHFLISSGQLRYCHQMIWKRGGTEEGRACGNEREKAQESNYPKSRLHCCPISTFSLFFLLLLSCSVSFCPAYWSVI